MVIQRWQSVWLLIAAILVGVFCFVPMAVLPADPAEAASASLVAPLDYPAYFIVNLVVAVLLFLAIFLFKDTRRQKQVTMICMLLLVVSAATACCVVYGWTTAGGALEWMGSIFLLLGALVFAFLAYRGIRSDERLLRAADRLR